MNRRNHRFRMHTSSPYGPSRPPFSPSSPRFLNPWPHSPQFRQQYIPHYTNSFNQSSPNSSDSSFNEHSPSGSRWHHSKKSKHNYTPREANIEDYVKDSMLENPWSHLEKSKKDEEKQQTVETNINHSVESNHQRLSDVSHLDGSACQQEKAEVDPQVGNSSSAATL